MSDNNTEQKYEVVDLEFNYDKLVFEEEEYAAIVMAEYNSNQSLVERMGRALRSGIGSEDSTPFQMYGSPREVLVSKDESEELQKTADRVLEE